MNKRITSIIAFSTLAFAAGFSLVELKRVTNEYIPVHASTLPTTISLEDNTPSEIRDYYSSLNDLSTDERRGEELLKSLKPILQENMVYYDYGSASSVGVNHIYTITDRDWAHSPVTTIKGGTYNSNTNEITNFNHTTELKSNPYLKMLYVDYTKTEKTDSYTGSGVKYDKEHVWSQSHGFKAASGATGPAGTDLHNLIAGDSGVNRNYHNNYSYGIVDEDSEDAKIAGETTKNSYGWYITGNKYGVSTITNPEDEFEKVFEPLDADKGRIARALLYMVARYNNISGNDTITNFEPNLELVDYIISGGTSAHSTATESAKYGILSVLLDWNRRFLPDQFEIHRNNLIYNNYQHNRNPFIDFPEWADYIWGNEQSGYQSTGYAKPLTDNLNQFGSEGNDPLPEVNATGVALNHDTATVAINKTIYLKPVFTPTNTTNKHVTWTSSDETVAIVNASGKITGIKEGTATISITTEDGGFTASCVVTVERTLTAIIQSSNTFTPALPTSSETVNSTDTEHLDETSEIAFKEQGIYKTTNTYIMFAKGKGRLFNTENLGYVKSVKLTFTSGAAATAKAGVYFGSTVQSTYQTASNETIPNKETSPRVKTWTNSNSSYGYFQVSNDNTANCQIASIEVLYEPSEKELTSLTVSGYTSSFTQYDDFEFGGTATAHFNDGSTLDVTKKVEVTGYDTDVAGNQTVTVSYSYLGVTKTATYTINVTALATIDSVTLSQSAITIDLYHGSTYQLSATVTGTGDFDDSVTWSTFSDAVATVSNSGLVTAKKVGSTTIRATSVGNYSFYGDCTVTVIDTTPTVSSVTLNHSELELDLNGTKTATLVATVNGTNNPPQEVTWNSSAAGVATVSNGTVTAVGKGTTTITATSTYDTRRFASCTVTVKDTSSTESYTADELTKTVINSTSYTSDWSGVSVSGGSGAVYTGNSSTDNTKNAINIRQTNRNSGIVTTASGGYIRKVEVSWHNDTNIAAVLQVFVSNSAYTSATDLWSDETAGTSAGSIAKASQTELDISGDYTFVGVRVGENHTYYLLTITFYWEAAQTKDLSSIEVAEPKTSYEVGDTFVKPTVTAHFDNGSSADVTNAATFTGYDLSVAGNYEVTVSYTYGSTTKTATYNITVVSTDPIAGTSPYNNGVEYRMYLQSGENRLYYTGQFVNTNYGAVTNDFTSGGVYVKFVASGNGQKLYFDDNGVNTYITLNGTQFSTTTVMDDATVWQYDTSRGMLFTSANSRYYGLGNTSYDNINVVQLKNITKAVGFEETADSFSYMFLNEMVCNNAGTSAPTFNEGFNWSTFETRYNALASEEKTRISNANKNQNGNNIEKMLARYEYVVAKYGTSSYKNFLNKSITPLAGSLTIFTTRNSNALSLIVIISIISSTALLVVISRKRKHN